VAVLEEMTVTRFVGGTNVVADEVVVLGMTVTRLVGMDNVVLNDDGGITEVLDEDRGAE